jgi:hypothetical protein
VRTTLRLRAYRVPGTAADHFSLVKVGGVSLCGLPLRLARPEAEDLPICRACLARIRQGFHTIAAWRRTSP